MSPALDSLALQVYQDYLDLKVSSDQKEILVFLAALVHRDDLALMVHQDLKVFCKMFVCVWERVLCKR